jgi:hypothetical protein
MRKIGRYLLITLATITVSLTSAYISVSAQCPPVHELEYSCYNTGFDESYCYYRCYCADWLTEDACERALAEDGFEAN